jgi:hypothetical protein
MLNQYACFKLVPRNDWRKQCYSFALAGEQTQHRHVCEYAPKFAPPLKKFYRIEKVTKSGFTVGSQLASIGTSLRAKHAL